MSEYRMYTITLDCLQNKHTKWSRRILGHMFGTRPEWALTRAINWVDRYERKHHRGPGHD